MNREFVTHHYVDMDILPIVTEPAVLQSDSKIAQLPQGLRRSTDFRMSVSVSEFFWIFCRETDVRARTASCSAILANYSMVTLYSTVKRVFLGG